MTISRWEVSFYDFRKMCHSTISYAMLLELLFKISFSAFFSLLYFSTGIICAYYSGCRYYRLYYYNYYSPIIMSNCQLRYLSLSLYKHNSGNPLHLLQNYQKIGHTSWTEFFQISKELTRHAEERHNVFGTEVETCFSLQCSGCTEKYELPGELKFWDEHMENMPCKNRRFKSR